jgi:hypothetical protein
VIVPKKKFHIPSSEEIREARRRALEGEPMSPSTVGGIFFKYCRQFFAGVAQRFRRGRR